MRNSASVILGLPLLPLKGHAIILRQDTGQGHKGVLSGNRTMVHSGLPWRIPLPWALRSYETLLLPHQACTGNLWQGWWSKHHKLPTVRPASAQSTARCRVKDHKIAQVTLSNHWKIVLFSTISILLDSLDLINIQSLPPKVHKPDFMTCLDQGWKNTKKKMTLYLKKKKVTCHQTHECVCQEMGS